MNEDLRDTDSDEVLRGRFESLRRDEARRAPLFRAVLAREESASSVDEISRLRGSWLPGVAFAAAAAGLLWLTVGIAESPHETPWIAAGQWTMPTDVLLDLSTIPGSELLSDLPEIGGEASLPIDGATNPVPQERIQA